MIEALSKQAFIPNASTPEAFGAFWQAQVPIWRELVTESGATAE